MTMKAKAFLACYTMLAWMISTIILAPLAIAQYSNPPDILLSTDKDSYAQFEPVLLQVSLVNTSPVEQAYGPVGISYPYSLLFYDITDPQGEVVRMHKLFTEGTVSWTALPYAPGTTRSKEINLLLFYPIMEEIGTYIVEVHFPSDANDLDGDYVSSSISFDVQALQEVSPSVVSTVAEVKQDILDLEEWGVTRSYISAKERLDSLLINVSMPPHLNELVQILGGIYSEINYWEGQGTIDEKDQRYEQFIETHPNSVYTPVAQYGTTGFVIDSSSDPDTPDNGSCLQIPVEADITFATTSVWPTGYNAELTITNTGLEAIRGWQLTFDLAPDITNLWNGQLTSEGTLRTVTDAGHNGVIAPGGSTTFGFQVQSSTVAQPTSFSFNPDQCTNGGPSVDIAFTTTSVWATGYNAEITITNTGLEAIRGWQLAFDLTPEITNLWNGQLTSEGSRRTVTDAGHNGVIAPGQSTTFGFQVQSGTVVEPSDYAFAFWTLGPPQ